MEQEEVDNKMLDAGPLPMAPRNATRKPFSTCILATGGADCQ